MLAMDDDPCAAISLATARFVIHRGAWQCQFGRREEVTALEDRESSTRICAAYLPKSMLPKSTGWYTAGYASM